MDEIYDNEGVAKFNFKERGGYLQQENHEKKTGHKLVTRSGGKFRSRTENQTDVAMAKSIIQSRTPKSSTTTNQIQPILLQRKQVQRMTHKQERMNARRLRRTIPSLFHPIRRKLSKI